MKQFFSKNKVLLFGLLSAVIIPLHELYAHGQVSIKVAVFAVFTAGLTWAARNLRGQWATIAGLLGTAVSTYITMDQNGSISWPQLILQFVIAVLAAVAPPAKSLGYEKSDVIESAKLQGEKIEP
jgi:uncharacterized membrane protein YhhN